MLWRRYLDFILLLHTLIIYVEFPDQATPNTVALKQFSVVNLVICSFNPYSNYGICLLHLKLSRFLFYFCFNHLLHFRDFFFCSKQNHGNVRNFNGNSSTTKVFLASDHCSILCRKCIVTLKTFLHHSLILLFRSVLLNQLYGKGCKSVDFEVVNFITSPCVICPHENHRR